MFEKYFCYQTVMFWIKKAAEKVEAQAKEIKGSIPMLEMDELFTYKKIGSAVWTAIDRNKLRFAAFEVGGCNGF